LEWLVLKLQKNKNTGKGNKVKHDLSSNLENTRVKERKATRRGQLEVEKSTGLAGNEDLSKRSLQFTPHKVSLSFFLVLKNSKKFR